MKESLPCPGSILKGSLRSTSVGIDFDDGIVLSKADCSHNLRALLDQRKANNFALGDQLNHTLTHYGERYLLALEFCTLEYQTLANIASVCRKVPFSRRRENLSFSHHETVASLPPDKQKQFLKLAEDRQLSAADLRMAIRQSQRAPEVAELPSTADSEAARLTAWLAEGMRLLAPDRTKDWPPERRAAFATQWQRLTKLASPLLSKP